jgi:hypothetical protein
MNIREPEQIRQELALDQAINAQLNDLVKQANQTAAVLRNDTRLEENQLRNLVNVALESGSVEVVVNFIRYQIGRSGNAWGTREDDFGHMVIQDLRGRVHELAEKAVETLRGKDIPVDEALRDEAYVRLMQLYLGYLNRVFYYAKKTKSFDRLKEVR